MAVAHLVKTRIKRNNLSSLDFFKVKERKADCCIEVNVKRPILGIKLALQYIEVWLFVLVLGYQRRANLEAHNLGDCLHLADL